MLGIDELVKTAAQMDESAMDLGHTELSRNIARRVDALAHGAQVQEAFHKDLPVTHKLTSSALNHFLALRTETEAKTQMDQDYEHAHLNLENGGSSREVSTPPPREYL